MQAFSHNKYGDINIIWNITRLCPWGCSICCVDAIHVEKYKSHVIMKSEALNNISAHKRDKLYPNVYEQASNIRISRGDELSLNEKIDIINNMCPYQPTINFSGGDPLIIKDNIKVIQHASSLFGRNHIIVSTTGYGLRLADPECLSECIYKMNITYDICRHSHNGYRPNRYNMHNILSLRKYIDRGIIIRAECPLTRENSSSYRMISGLYVDLHNAGVNELLLMRVFPVGRNEKNIAHICLSKNEYLRSINMFMDLERKYKSPRVITQCALKILNGATVSHNPCDALNKSFGLMADGTLLISPWAINTHGEPINQTWVLGNMKYRKLFNILTDDKYVKLTKRANENIGHCKVIAYIRSDKASQEDKIFDTTDDFGQ